MVVAFFVLRDSPGTGSMFERMTHRMGKRSSSAASLGVHDSTAMLAAVAPPDTEMMPALGKPKRRVPGVGFWRSAKRLLSIPGVRLAYWIHFTTPFPTNVFLLLWGTPFLTGGLGLSASAAGGYLSLIVVTGMFTSLVLGPLSSRFVERRVWITVGIVLVIMTNWVLVLCWPGSPPTWLVISLMIVIAFGTPASMVSFEVSRSHTPRSFAGFSTGLVNTGGFTSTLLVILLIGLVLDLQGAGSPEAYTLDAFRWAFAVQVPFWLFGLAMVFREIKRTGEWMRANGRTLR
jgi:MFS family permease